MAFSLIAHALGANGSSSTTSATNMTGATLIAGLVSTYGSPVTSNFSNNGTGNTYTWLTERGTGNGRGQKGRMFYCVNPVVSSSMTFTLNVGFPSIFVSGWSGVDTASAFDKEDGSQADSVTSLAATSVTPTNDNALVLQGLSIGDDKPGTITCTGGGGYTILDQISGNSGVTECGALAYQIQTTKTATAPTYSGWSPADSVNISSAVFNAASGGTNYPLTASGGSFSFTGQAATLKVARVLSSGNGSYAFTGQVATLKRGYKVGAGNGSYTFAGQTVAFIRGLKVSAQSGSFAFTGQDATLTKGGVTLLATAGSFTVNGQAANLEYGRVLSAGSGSFAFSGQAATLRKGRTLAAESGSYTFSGQSVTFSRTYILSIGSGAFVFTGSDAALEWSGQSIWTPQSTSLTTWTPQVAASTSWTEQ